MKKPLVMMFVAGFAFSTLISILLARREIWIDLQRGSLKEKIYAFPFTYESELNDRAFPLLFSSGENKRENWLLVDRGNFFTSKIGFSAYTTGNKFLAHQRTLLSAFRAADLRADKRRDIARIYFQLIESGNYSGASDFVMKTWEEATYNTQR